MSKVAVGIPFELIHESGQKIEAGYTPSEIMDMTGLRLDEISRLRNGRRDEAKGWRLGAKVTIPLRLVPKSSTTSHVNITTREETYEERVSRISSRFEVMRQLAFGMMDGKLRSFIVSGPPGIAKTFELMQIMEYGYRQYGRISEFVKGYITAVEFYKILYKHCASNHTIILDDADKVFKDEDGLSLLKAALDTTDKRLVTYRSNTYALNGIPQEFYFDGNVIFITNKDIDRELKGKSAIVNDLEALVSRSTYLDLSLHENADIVAWIRYKVLENKILQQQGLTETQERDVVDWITEHQDEIRNLSIRKAIHLAAQVKIYGENWKQSAAITEFRTDRPNK